MEMIIMLALMAVVFIALNSFTKRSNQKRLDERERMLQEDLVPGAWVHTSVGFFGRFVDLDGDVVILETPGGEETYWNKAVIRSVGDLPFEAEEDLNGGDTLTESQDVVQEDSSGTEAIEPTQSDIDTKE